MSVCWRRLRERGGDRGIFAMVAGVVGRCCSCKSQMQVEVVVGGARSDSRLAARLWKLHASLEPSHDWPCATRDRVKTKAKAGRQRTPF